MSTVLVTGAAGNLGLRTTGHLTSLRSVERVVAVDLSPVAGVGPKIEVHRCDLAQPGAQDRLAKMARGTTAIIHLAWQATGRQNLTILHHVLDAAEQLDPELFVFLSSATVYGAWPDNPVPLTEEIEPRPNPELAYAVEKRAAETLIERWHGCHRSVAVAVLRPSSTVGAPGAPLYQALAASRRPQLGAEGRMVQYLHVDDLATAVVHTLEHKLAGIYNVAPDGGVREDIAGALAGGSAMLPLSPKVRASMATLRWRLWGNGAPPGSEPYTEHSWVIAADKLRLTGWQPEYSSEQALVVSDKRGHWDELPQSRRVAVTLGAGASIVAALAGISAAWWRRAH